MKNRFQIKAVDFQDEDLPLFYSFGYRHQNEDYVRWFKKLSSSLPEVSTHLPASQEGIVPVIEVCDSFEACVVAEGKEILEVEFQALSREDIQ